MLSLVLSGNRFVTRGGSMNLRNGAQSRRRAEESVGEQVEKHAVPHIHRTE